MEPKVTYKVTESPPGILAASSQFTVGPPLALLLGAAQAGSVPPDLGIAGRRDRKNR